MVGRVRGGVGAGARDRCRQGQGTRGCFLHLSLQSATGAGQVEVLWRLVRGAGWQQVHYSVHKRLPLCPAARLTMQPHSTPTHQAAAAVSHSISIHASTASTHPTPSTQ